MDNKQQSSFEVFVKPVLVLFVIAVVVSGLLAYINQLTAPIILANEKKVADTARAQVLSAADAFTQMEVAEEVKQSTGTVEMYKADNGTGFVITTSVKGYGGALPVMVGLDAEGTVVAVKIMANEETPGLGKKVEEASFTDQFKGLANGQTGTVNAISGATISSKAVVVAVDGAMEAFDIVAKGAAVVVVPSTLDETSALEEKMIPQAKAYEKVAAQGEGIDVVLRADGELGFVIVAIGKGYGGDLPVAVAFDAAGKITAVKVLKNEETQGLGSKVADPAFIDTLVGKTKADIASVENIAGATVSSEAVKAAVLAACDEFLAVKEGA